MGNRQWATCGFKKAVVICVILFFGAHMCCGEITDDFAAAEDAAEKVCEGEINAFAECTEREMEASDGGHPADVMLRCENNLRVQQQCIQNALEDLRVKSSSESQQQQTQQKHELSESSPPEPPQTLPSPPRFETQEQQQEDTPKIPTKRDHSVLKGGPRLSLLEPLHWSVTETSGNNTHSNAAGEPHAQGVKVCFEIFCVKRFDRQKKVSWGKAHNQIKMCGQRPVRGVSEPIAAFSLQCHRKPSRQK